LGYHHTKESHVAASPIKNTGQSHKWPRARLTKIVLTDMLVSLENVFVTGF